MMTRCGRHNEMRNQLTFTRFLVERKGFQVVNHIATFLHVFGIQLVTLGLQLEICTGTLIRQVMWEFKRLHITIVILGRVDLACRTLGIPTTMLILGLWIVFSYTFLTQVQRLTCCVLVFARFYFVLIKTRLPIKTAMARRACFGTT